MKFGPAHWWSYAAIFSFALAMTGGSAHAADGNFVIGGVSDSANGYYTYLGAGGSLTGSLNTSGVLFRGDVGYGDFTYQHVAGVSDNVRVEQVDLMPGYQFVTGPTHISLYVGANDINDHFNAGLHSQDNGDNWGAKGEAEIYTQMGGTALLGVASYSTAQRSYFALGKADEALTSTVSAGPQLQVDGSEFYHEWRVGGHVGVMTWSSVSLTVSAGYENSLHAQDGVYGALDIWAGF